MRNYPLLLVIYRVNNSLSLHKISILVEYFADVAPKMLIGDIGKISKMNFYSSLILRLEIKKSAPNLSLDADFVVSSLHSHLQCHSPKTRKVESAE